MVRVFYLPRAMPGIPETDISLPFPSRTQRRFPKILHPPKDFPLTTASSYDKTEKTQDIVVFLPRFYNQKTKNC